jgi:hypothetical protein
MVFKATLNNISVILWQSVLLVEETVEPGDGKINIHRTEIKDFMKIRCY